MKNKIKILAIFGAFLCFYSIANANSTHPPENLDSSFECFGNYYENEKRINVKVVIHRSSQSDYLSGRLDVEKSPGYFETILSYDFLILSGSRNVFVYEGLSPDGKGMYFSFKLDIEYWNEFKYLGNISFEFPKGNYHYIWAVRCPR